MGPQVLGGAGKRHCCRPGARGRQTAGAGSPLQLTGGASSKQQVHVRVRKRKHGAAALPGAHTCEAAAHLVPALAGVWGALGCPV